MALKLNVLSSPVLPSPAMTPGESCGAKRQDTPAEFAPAKNCGCATPLALMLTRRCNMSCGHCSVESSPRIKGEPSLEELLNTVRAASRAEVGAILLTGGEPMLREDVVLTLVRECKALNISVSVTTNGFWGKDPDKAKQKVNALINAGLGLLTVSYDIYHAEFGSVESVLNIARAARARRFMMNINITRIANDPTLDALVAPLTKLEGVRLRFYDVQPIGRGRNLDPSTLRAEVEGFCNACSIPAATDDGRITACNGPSYFESPDSPLAIGSLRAESLATLIERHKADPILETIRTFGPSRLRAELQQAGGFESMFEGPPPAGMCQLCRSINSNPEAVRVLRARLSEPRRVAERIATQRIIEGERSAQGALNRNYINGPGAARVLVQAARNARKNVNERWEPDTVKILGRADLDWNTLVGVMISSGLARPLLPVLDDPQLTRWAPEFFRQQLREAAPRDAMREAVGRDALERISAALTQLGARGVLLKGAALAVLAESAGQNGQCPVPRSGCDIDIWVEPEKATALREKLLASGFTGPPHDVRRWRNIQHLPLVRFGGVMIEIHTRIMQKVWRLPEREMLERARPMSELVSRPGLENIYVLDGEGMLLHALMHVAHHYFLVGVKAAWDVAWILDTHPTLDWERLKRWVQSCRMPLSFYTPARLLCREFGFPLPNELLEDGRHGKLRRFRRNGLEVMAREHLFGNFSTGCELNPCNRNALWLMLHENSWGRAAHLASLVHPDLIRNRREARIKRRTEEFPRYECDREAAQDRLLLLRQGVRVARQLRAASRAPEMN